jgi:N-acetylglucosamine repressor
MSDEVTSYLRPQLLGRMTQRAVVEALRAKGPLSRADISRITGISPTTVSSAVTQVLAAGLVEEMHSAVTGPGRPGKLLRLATVTAQVIGVSVEPEWCEMVAGGLDGQPRPNCHARFPTPNTYTRLLAEIERHARAWINEPDVRTLGLGLSLPGLVDTTGDRAVFSPNLHQTDDQRPGHDLANRLGLNTILIQESDALCLAERQVHATDDLAILDVVAGLGIGVLAAGRLLHRDLGLPRELGHVTAILDGELCGCGNRGCLETLATDMAFARMVSHKVGRSLTMEEVSDLVRGGQVNASNELERVLDYLAVAIAAVANLFAPPLIVVHGRILDLAPNMIEVLTTRAQPRMLTPLQKRCRLTKSSTTKAQGAAAGILDRVFELLGPMLPFEARI